VSKFLKRGGSGRAVFKQERYAPTNHNRGAGGEGNDGLRDGLKYAAQRFLKKLGGQASQLNLKHT
jgi:hypothetical protein